MKTKLGQYFTTNITLKENVYNFILNKPSTILEPSIGRGDLVVDIKNRNPLINFDMYEIDTTINFLDKINKNDIIFGDFLEQNITKLYKTIIGNPPYIKNKKGNIYIKFIEKCYNLLDKNGELIFIIPSDFFKLTSAYKLLNKMVLNGVITHIFHPHNERLFDNANIDVLVMRYCKNKLLEQRVFYNDKLLHIINSDGLITFEENNSKNTCIKDYFDIYVGIVSGKESVYKNEQLGNITVLNGVNKYEKYIYVKKFPCSNEEVNKHLLQNKECLLNRKIRKFNDLNWFEWGAPRNIKIMEENIDKECIYIYNLTRKNNVAFLGKINYFGGNLLMLKPKKSCNLENIVSFLNSCEFKNNFIYSGRFKIGHRQLSNSYIEEL